MKRYYAGIFLISAATLLLEISLTRVFSVLFFHHFAFLIISTALFGFGFSGIYLFLTNKSISANRLSYASLLFAASIVIAYKGMLLLPYGFKDIFENPAAIVRLIGSYAMLAIPFLFSGYVIGLILASYPDKSGRYYFFDLAGGAVGCLAVLWLVPLLGASGSIVVAAALSAAAAMVFWPQARILRYSAIALSVLLIFVCPRAEELFRLPLGEIFAEKHGSFLNAPNTEVEYSAWSPVSRIDVLATAPNKLLYLDGGSNVSFLLPFHGKLHKLQPRVNWRAVPYMITFRNRVCIIGPGGGEDVLTALSHGSRSIDAVEMDPLIVEILRGRYRDFTGGIFDAPGVRVVNDEGRSFLRRSTEKYDLIQTVHNCSPMALASGAFNLSESYLFTVESFHEYWNHLADNGMLAINRSGILRAASIASVVLQNEGITDPENYVIVTSRQRGGTETGFYLKKGRISAQDLQNLDSLRDRTGIRIEYAPLPDFQTKENAYYRLLSPKLRSDFIREADVVLDAPTDNKPFFDHYQHFGSFQQSTQVLPKEINNALQFHNMGDLAVLALLAEAAVLSFVFLLLPLLWLRKKSMKREDPAAGRPFLRFVVYFLAIGAGFILIEISLFQKYILFMGQPVYSISAVLFSLLLSAGCGSLFFQTRFREGSERRWLAMICLGIAVSLLFEAFVVPKLFGLFLGSGRTVRFVLSGLFILPVGFVLGVPFPLGIRLCSFRTSYLIPWAWGLNAYATVVGSILCVVLALMFGFQIVFLIAFLIYVAGFATLART